MKKATKKRERKYGKKEEDAVETIVIKKKIKQKVKIIVDYGMIREFPSRAMAERFINKQHKEADESNRPRSSFQYI